ncbi:MAG: hypothetical protein ABW101_03930 [Candidatus Thiodiazotropha sp.]
MIDWTSLDQEQQLKLREAYGHYLDTLPPTCSLDMKIARFKEWLARQGIRFEMEDPVRS